MKGLNPTYTLPNRKTISSALIPALYEACLNAGQHELHSVESVCLTTDKWTSLSVDNYIAATAYFITNDFELKSLLLQCSVMFSPHTSKNLAEKIEEITDKFHLSENVLLVVTDNASNIKGAVTNKLQWNHF